MDFQRQITRKLHDEHVSIIALLERFGQALARLRGQVPAAGDSDWNVLLGQLGSALQYEVTRHLARAARAARRRGLAYAEGARARARRALELARAEGARGAGAAGRRAARRNDGRQAMDRVRNLKVRRLARTDLDAVVQLDAALAGRTRRAYFERRLAIALRQPELHLQFAVEQDGAHCGHALARVLEGEFGASGTGLRLEVISVAPDARGRGAGRALHEALEQEAAKRSIVEFRTTLAWRDHEMLQFLDRLGYALAPSHVIECALHRLAGERAAQARPGDKRGDPNDWSAPAANDYERLARDSVDVSLLTAKD